MSILDDISIHINTEEEVPEIREYVEYSRDAPWLFRLLRRIFKAKKIKGLHLKSRQALLSKVIEKGLETLDEQP